MNAQALGFVEERGKKNIDNRMYGTDAYFQMRKTNKEARRQKRDHRRRKPIWSGMLGNGRRSD